ncbi:MAG: ATP-binding protein [Myxococcota bacterium]
MRTGDPRRRCPAGWAVLLAVLCLPVDVLANPKLSQTLSEIEQADSVAFETLSIELNLADQFAPAELLQVAEAIRASGQPDHEVFAISLRCGAATRLREIDEARARCEDAVRLSERAGLGARFAAFRQHGKYALEFGALSEGVESMLTALDAAERLNHPGAQATALTALGGAAYYSFAYTESAQLLERAIQSADAADAPISVAVATNNLGVVLHGLGRYRDAFDAYTQAYEEISQDPVTARAPITAMLWFGQARSLAKMGEPEEALKRMLDGLERFQAIESARRGSALLFLGEVYQELGENESALATVSSAKLLFKGSGIRLREATLVEAELALALGRPAETLEAVEPLLRDQSNPAGDVAKALNLRASARAALGQYKDATADFKLARLARDRWDRRRSESRADFVRARFEADTLARTNRSLRSAASRERLLSAAALLVGLALVGVVWLVFRTKLRERQLETERERSYRLETIGRLTGGVAHDFNNMLQVILQGVEHLDDGDLGQDAAEVVADIKLAATSGAEIVDKLLVFSRSDQRSPRVVDLRALLVDLRTLLERTAGDSVQLTLEVEADLPELEVDQGKLVAALINLVANSRDAIERNGRIVLRAKRTLDNNRVWATIEVVDNGAGIAPELKPRLFEPFFTTKPVGAGSGLGLSVVYGFVQDSGGRVEVNDSPDGGTSVSLLLPERRGASRPR